MEDHPTTLHARVARLERENAYFRHFFVGRQAHVAQSKIALEKATQHNYMKKLILEEESQHLDVQKKLLEEEEKLLQSMLAAGEDFMDQGQVQVQPLTESVSAKTVDVQHNSSASATVGTATATTVSASVQHETSQASIETLAIKEEADGQKSTVLKPDTDELYPVTALSIPIEKLDMKIKMKSSDSGRRTPVPSIQRSSRGRIIKLKKKDYLPSSMAVVNTPKKTVALEADSMEVVPGGIETVQSLDGEIDSAISSTDDAQVEAETTSEMEDFSDKTTEIIPSVPVRFSTRTRKPKKEYSPERESDTEEDDKLEITTDEDSDTDSQSSPKKLRVKKLAARSIKVYIPMQNLPQPPKMFTPRFRQPSPRKVVPETSEKSVKTYEKTQKVVESKPEPQHIESNKKHVKQSTKSQKYQTQTQVNKTKKKRQPPKKCAYCPKIFNTSHGRKYHELNHQGKKPHECNICDAAFVQKALLKRHMFNHSGVPREKKHQCKVCMHSFALKYDLVLHMKRHDPERKQECGVCLKKFSDARYFKKHVASCKSDAQDLKCPNCERKYRIKAFLDKHVEICRPS